jgi:hypothetical protein
LKLRDLVFCDLYQIKFRRFAPPIDGANKTAAQDTIAARGLF